MKDVLWTALEQVDPLQENTVGGAIAKRVFPRRDKAVNEILADEDFKKFLKVFNDKAAKTLSEIATEVQDGDSRTRRVQAFAQDFTQDFLENVLPQIEARVPSSVSVVQEVRAVVAPLQNQRSTEWD